MLTTDAAVEVGRGVLVAVAGVAVNNPVGVGVAVNTVPVGVGVSG